MHPKPVPIPEYICIDITHACPLRCKMCYLRDGDSNAVNLLDDAALAAIVDETAEWGVPVLQITGGEPFAAPQTREVVLRAAALGLKVELATNGYLLTPKLIEELASHRKVHFHFSLDGACAETHDRIRGRKGSFDKVMAALHQLNDMGAIDRDQVGLSCVVMEDNLDELDDLFRLTVEHRVFLHLQPLLGDNADPIKGAQANGYRLPPERLPTLDALIDRMIERAQMPKRRISNEIHHLEGFKSFYRGISIRRGCTAGYGYLGVGPDGNAYQCNIEYGSVLKQGLRAVWYGEAANRMRHELKRCQMPCLQTCSFTEARGYKKLLFEIKNYFSKKSGLS